MKRDELNLDREFIKWFYEESYPDEGSNRATVQGHSYGMTPNVETRDYWMREAFKHGAKTMADDMLYTLACYACACEGLDPELLTPAEVFDRARENLFEYVTRKLEQK